MPRCGRRADPGGRRPGGRQPGARARRRRASRLTAVADAVGQWQEARALVLGDRAGSGGLPEVAVTLGAGGARRRHPRPRLPRPRCRCHRRRRRAHRGLAVASPRASLVEAARFGAAAGACAVEALGRALVSRRPAVEARLRLQA